MSGDDALREAIRAVLVEHRGPGYPSKCSCGASTYGQPQTWHTTDALLPVVLRYGREKAAEELRAAAGDLVDDTGLDLIGSWQLHARADALTTTDPT